MRFGLPGGATLGALVTVPPFLRMLWRAGPRLAVAALGLRLVRAVLPVAILFVAKLIIDEVVRLRGAGMPGGV